MEKLSIIILSFNTKELLKQCLKSLNTKQHPPVGGPSSKLEVVVVDNGSADGSPDMVKKEFSNVFLIQNKTNLGFAKAVNQGIKKATGDYILLLNSDTKVKKDSLEKMIEFARLNPQAGVIGARLLNPDGKIQPSCYHFPSIRRAIAEYWFGQKGAYEKYAEMGDNPSKVEVVVGAAMFIPQMTLKKVGLFDERYFVYFEDLDYCRRVKEAGLAVFYLPQAEIIHHHGQSTAKVGSETYKWLSSSSKIFNGIVKYFVLTLVIFMAQKWQKIISKK